MGISCQINLFKPSEGAFMAGSTVSGVIKYGVDEVTVFDKITVSLKGHGCLVIHDDRRRRSSNHDVTYRHREDYVDVDHVTDNEKKTPHEIGMYETRFDFNLPTDIPSSLHYYGKDVRYRVRCNIIYYIRIKFERPGFLQFAKRFKKELTVVSAIKPKLSKEPIIYGEQKKLFQLFASKNSIVNIKANIKNSVITPGGKIDLDYDVLNDTNLSLKGVETKLVEIYTFTTAGGRETTLYSDVDNTDTKTGSIKSGENQNIDIIINVPSDKSSLGNSSIVSRNYVVRIIVEIPFPHTNAVLDIPVEIVNQGTEVCEERLPDIEVGNEPPGYDSPPPPSYWEAMGEETKDDDDYFESKGDEKSL